MNQSERERIARARLAGGGRPSPAAGRDVVTANRTGVVRDAELPDGYAALCQEAGIVPIVGPEVPMQVARAIDRRHGVTSAVCGAGLDRLP